MQLTVEFETAEEFKTKVQSLLTLFTPSTTAPVDSTGETQRKKPGRRKEETESVPTQAAAAPAQTAASASAVDAPVQSATNGTITKSTLTAKLQEVLAKYKDNGKTVTELLNTHGYGATRLSDVKEAAYPGLYLAAEKALSTAQPSSDLFG